MGRSRSYSAAFRNVSVSAVQDLIAIYCGATMAIELHGFVLGQVTGTTVENLEIAVKRLPAVVTSGSGGALGAVNRLMRGDALATVSARINDTTLAITSGSEVALHRDVFNTINGCQFFWPPADIPTVGLGEAAILELVGAPATALVMSGTLYFGEVF
jgi:hypothetical protein